MLQAFALACQQYRSYRLDIKRINFTPKHIIYDIYIIHSQLGRGKMHFSYSITEMEAFGWVNESQPKNKTNIMLYYNGMDTQR